MVLPCVNALCHIATTMKDMLGMDIGMRHAPIDLTKDITILMDSLSKHKIYHLTEGHVLDNDNFLVPDVVSVGLQQLTDSSSNPLTEYKRTLPCPTYSRWTLLESRWFSRVHLEFRCIFCGWEHSQIGMHNPPGFHQDSRWTPDEPRGVSGVHFPDSSLDSTWTHPRVHPPGVQEEFI